MSINPGNPLGTSSRAVSRERDEIPTGFIEPEIVAGPIRGQRTGATEPVRAVATQGAASLNFFGNEEVFTREERSDPTVKKFVARGKIARGANLFTQDVSVGKIGTLGSEAVKALEEKLMGELYCGEVAIMHKSHAIQGNFRAALYLYLAVNSGSIGNVTGRMGVADDSEPLSFNGCAVSATQVATILGDKAYAYMRARATEIRDTLESMFATVDLPEAEKKFPGLCSTASLVKVVAARRGLAQYPQYAAVGSEYALGTPAFLISLIAVNSAKVLEGVGTNVRHSEVA